MRIDKYLWCVRLAKTRSIATELVAKGKVKLNNAQIKPAKEVKHSDVIQIVKHTSTFSYEVIGIIDRRVGAPLVKEFLRDITPQEEIDKFKEYQANQRRFVAYDDGKPSKKDRRSLDEFLENWSDED
ncbi:MAG: RNA-binding S4 domain-containing protein [Crocinitomicaceae bacterium]|nr:RNA-binding S4 domain-containing protein [Crocinitomicaceae bacterium]